jgi:DNA-nicking Smr family endonuclease
VSGRVTSDAERREFQRTFAERRPLRVPRIKSGTRKAAAGGGGVNGATLERLRRGLLTPQARLDLHGMNEETAYHALHAFLHAAHARGLRLVLVVTGKGNPREQADAPWLGAPHGVLKQMVPRWLKQRGPAALIAHVQEAHARHGGGGALYVYLRKR